MFNKMIVLFFASCSLFAQVDNYTFFQLRFLYDEGQFEKVVEQGNSLLAEPEKLTREQLISVHNLMAQSNYSINSLDSSRVHFYTVLALDEEFVLDPVKTSPKIINFFDEIKKHFLESANDQNQAPVTFTRYVFQKDRRPEAGLRSFALPGWGQSFKFQKRRALAFGGAFASSLVATGTFIAIEKNKKDAYKNETDVDKIPSKYDSYNSSSKFRRISQYTLFTIWAASIADALFTEYHPQVWSNGERVGLAFDLPF